MKFEDMLPDYDLSKLFEKKPPHDPDELRDESEDIEWVQVKRIKLLPYLHKQVKFIGTIVRFDMNSIFHLPRALLANVIIEKKVEVTHLWIESKILQGFCLYDHVKCKGEVYCYKKGASLIGLSIKDIATIRRKMRNGS